MQQGATWIMYIHEWKMSIRKTNTMVCWLDKFDFKMHNGSIKMPHYKRYTIHSIQDSHYSGFTWPMLFYCIQTPGCLCWSYDHRLSHTHKSKNGKFNTKTRAMVRQCAQCILTTNQIWTYAFFLLPFLSHTHTHTCHFTLKPTIQNCKQTL